MSKFVIYIDLRPVIDRWRRDQLIPFLLAQISGMKFIQYDLFRLVYYFASSWNPRLHRDTNVMLITQAGTGYGYSQELKSKSVLSRCLTQISVHTHRQKMKRKDDCAVSVAQYTFFGYSKIRKCIFRYFRVFVIVESRPFSPCGILTLWGFSKIFGQQYGK